MHIARLLSLLLIALYTHAATAEEAAPRISLFDGKTLSGWHLTGDAQAAAENGHLVIREGNGFLRTDHAYRDFILRLEYKPLASESWDSGIYFRAPLPAEGKTWPSRYQINLKAGQEGNVIGLPEATSTGLVKPGWNQFTLKVVGQQATLEINGQRAWQVESIERPAGYIGIQIEVPEGGQFAFRNLSVTELGYRALFSGEDFAGWEGAGAEASTSWKVEDGLLVCTGKRGTWLRSTEQFGDFNLRLQYKLKPGGNSGVYCRVPKSGKHHGADAGVEIQLLDDRAGRYAKLKPYQYTGSVYAIAPAEKHVGHAAGEWNTIEINALAPDYTVTHNGVVIVTATAEEFPKLAERLEKGYLGLQNHSEEVWFRHLRIGPAFPRGAER